MLFQNRVAIAFLRSFPADYPAFFVVKVICVKSFCKKFFVLLLLTKIQQVFQQGRSAGTQAGSSWFIVGFAVVRFPPVQLDQQLIQPIVMLGVQIIQKIILCPNYRQQVQPSINSLPVLGTQRRKYPGTLNAICPMIPNPRAFPIIHQLDHMIVLTMRVIAVCL